MNYVYFLCDSSIIFMIITVMSLVNFSFVIFVSFDSWRYLLVVWLMIVSVVIKMKFAANPIEVETGLAKWFLLIGNKCTEFIRLMR